MRKENSKRTRQRLIVKFKLPYPTSGDTLEQRCEALLPLIPNGSLVRPPGRSGRAVFSVDPTVDLRQLAREIARREDVDYAEPDVIDREAG